MAINRFRQLKQEEKKTLSKALPAEDVETLASTSDSDDDSEEETKDKVKFIFFFLLSIWLEYRWSCPPKSIYHEIILFCFPFVNNFLPKNKK